MEPSNTSFEEEIVKMAHHEITFPSKLDYGATGGPGYNTSVARSNTAYEVRNQNWANAVRTYEVTAGEKEAADHATLLGFFNGRKGKLHSFNLIDPNDNNVVGQNIGTGNGTAGPFQCKKTYPDSVLTTDRTIKKLISGTVLGVVYTIKIYVNGALQVAGVDYNVDVTTGLVTFIAGHFPAGGTAITADFYFYTPVRFDVDQPRITVEPGTVYTWDAVPMREVLL